MPPHGICRRFRAETSAIGELLLQSKSNLSNLTSGHIVMQIVLPHFAGAARRPREQHPHPGVVGEPDIRCHVHHLRPRRHRGPPEGVPRPGLVLPAEAGAGGQQGGHPQSRVCLHSARPHRTEEPLALNGPPRELLPVHTPQELVPHCSQDGQSATLTHGSL